MNKVDLGYAHIKMTPSHSVCQQPGLGGPEGSLECFSHAVMSFQ